MPFTTDSCDCDATLAHSSATCQRIIHDVVQITHLPSRVPKFASNNVFYRAICDVVASSCSRMAAKENRWKIAIVKIKLN